MKLEINHAFTGICDLNEALVNDAKLTIATEALDAIKTNRSYLERKLEDGHDPIYGINTGFGSLCDTVIPKNELAQLQVNLVRSHACGTGPEIDADIVKLILLLKAKSLSFGFSGVRPVIVEQLVRFYNSGILPVIHEQGSLGASGDLAPLAHMALGLMGEGDVTYKDEKQHASNVLEELEIAPIVLSAKEGLALLNGTQFMLAHLSHCLIEAYKLWNAAHEIAAISLEAYNCRTNPFFEGLGRIRAHQGQMKSAGRITELLYDSGLHNGEEQGVQDPYSFRCIPQVHGATYTTIEHCRQVAEAELNAVTDNPVVFNEEDQIISGGNFHGQELALALDFLGIAMSELANISERRSYLLVSGNRNLPVYLTPKPGTRSGFMIPQYTAASIVSQNKQLATPASVDSVPSSNGQEDHVSMGANAATKCKRIIDNVRTVLAIELMLAAQAWEFRPNLAKATATSKLVEAYRKRVATLKEDRYLSADIKTSVDFVKTYFTEL
ncbi:MAG: histidine ammonia-lyase [Bacteroidia bacterium]